MTDVFTKKKRSEIMSRIRSRGNATTELLVARALRAAGLIGWRRHPRMAGSPDFVFPRAKVAIHVHGCFWHGCSRCASGHIPKSRLEYWVPKLARTKERDKQNRRALRLAGYRSVVVWEHELREDRWLARLQAYIGRRI
jgi:DNA mismatch endonuclease (patch repair protein)